jgi:hypothetical protein
VNTRYEVLDWFGPSRGVIAICPVLMCYTIEIGSSLFLSGSFGCFPGMFSASFSLVLDVDLSFLFIVREAPHRI